MKDDKKTTGWWFFTNPSEKYARQNGFIFPQFSGWKKKDDSPEV